MYKICNCSPTLALYWSCCRSWRLFICYSPCERGKSSSLSYSSAHGCTASCLRITIPESPPSQTKSSYSFLLQERTTRRSSETRGTNFEIILIYCQAPLCIIRMLWTPARLKLALVVVSDRLLPQFLEGWGTNPMKHSQVFLWVNLAIYSMNIFDVKQ